MIIPALNERTTVGGVVSAAKGSDCVTDVIVVDDGSRDDTAEVAAAHGARVIVLDQNRGKAGAMKAGLVAAEPGVIVFLDADLIGLRPDHLRRLVEPVLGGQADMTVGIMRRGRTATDLAQAVAPFLSGLRAGRTEVFAPLMKLDEAGWGAEIALTLSALEMRRRVKSIRMDGVTQRMKEEKVGFAKGFAARLRMYWDILRAVPRVERARR